jgi:UDP-N-acetylmuramyl pentapeptide phosphotransferase/UDP-N-acetylglucosamine-1-phosphate transferase
MDGMDGLAGGMTVVGFGTFAILAWQTDDFLFASLSLIIAASAAGFLVFNIPPAKIFMGDTGSSTLGFLVAAFSLWATRNKIFPIWVTVLIFSPFIVDATVTLLRRLLRHEKIWKAHKSHYYQRLVRLGGGHRRTLLWEYVLMVACAASAFYAKQLSIQGQQLLIISWFVIYVLILLYIPRLEIAKERMDKEKNVIVKKKSSEVPE